MNEHSNDDAAVRAVLACCVEIATSTWSDACDLVGIQGLVEGLTQRAGTGRIAGFAVTAQHVSAELNQYDRSKFAVGRLVAAAVPGRIVMISSGGAAISSFGGIASLAAVNQGASGVIIDGACRDVDEIRAAGLWMASRHVSPRTGKGRLSLVDMGGPVIIGNIRVAAGDLVVADDTGIIVVPKGRMKEVLEAAQKVLEVDEIVERAVRAGTPFIEAAAQANYLPKPSDD